MIPAFLTSQARHFDLLRARRGHKPFMAGLVGLGRVLGLMDAQNFALSHSDHFGYAMAIALQEALPRFGSPVGPK